MGRAAAEDRRGLLLGLLSSCEKFAGVIAPLVGGPIYSSGLGKAAPAFASALVALTGLCATLAFSAAIERLEGGRDSSETKAVRVPETPETLESMDTLRLRTRHVKRE